MVWLVIVRNKEVVMSKKEKVEEVETCWVCDGTGEEERELPAWFNNNPLPEIWRVECGNCEGAGVY